MSIEPTRAFCVHVYRTISLKVYSTMDEALAYAMAFPTGEGVFIEITKGEFGTCQLEEPSQPAQ